jgi:uncharacterized membrane protein YgdD (TMEM256/DUF423 family)
MNRPIILLAALLGLTGVAIGAFGAHALPRWLGELPLDQQTYRSGLLEIGARYHMYHALALFGIGLFELLAPAPRLWCQRSAVAMLFGVTLFSGSLYLLALSGLKWLGMITPIGGVTLLLGWTCLAIASSVASQRAPSGTTQY